MAFMTMVMIETETRPRQSMQNTTTRPQDQDLPSRIGEGVGAHLLDLLPILGLTIGAHLDSSARGDALQRRTDVCEEGILNE
jgi:hypothetical protein